MSGYFLLDWATMAVSLFNTILLLWLGLTVLLNADKRSWAVWLAGSGLLLGGFFFVSHSAILGLGLFSTSWAMDLWWHVGWIPVITLPYIWYATMLWYAGFWENKASPLFKQQKPWFLAASLMVAGLLSLFVFFNPLPSYWQMAALNLSAAPSIGGIPILMLFYPGYVVVCVSLSLSVLRKPGPSTRLMGMAARERARHWLAGASVGLLLVALLVSWVTFLVITRTYQSHTHDLFVHLASSLARFDLVIAILVALVVLFLGQAIAAYEVFTGKTLPRRGLMRHWRRAVIFSSGYGLVVGWSLAFQLRPIYSLLLTALLMTFFYALLSWRSYAEREHTIEKLRPFVSSQQLYEQLLAFSPSFDPEADVQVLFRALCENVIGVRVAHLVPLGSLAPLSGTSLSYPPTGQPYEFASLPPFESRETMCVPIDPQDYHGAQWAVPLWSKRGLIGALLLGEKRDGSLYTQEEIEIARAGGERLTDTIASAETARRLVFLQRQKLMENQVLDQRTRRSLHDQVLPLLHAAMLSLSGGADPAEAIENLADAHRQISNLLRDLPPTVTPELARSGLIKTLIKTVEGGLRSEFDSLTWQVEPTVEQMQKTIPPLTAEVIYYASLEAIRNAARHGRGPDGCGPLNLSVTVTCNTGLELAIVDDGTGFQPGEKTREKSGQGLAIHSTMMAVVGGSLAIERVENRFTRVILYLPNEAWQPLE